MKAGVFELTERTCASQMSWLRGLASSLVGPGTNAEDAVQETMVAALEHPPALDRDVRPWLARVLANFIPEGTTGPTGAGGIARPRWARRRTGLPVPTS